MTPRQRMLAALEGGRPDCVPVAPYFWGEEYVWKLVGAPVWRLSLGGPETARDIVRAVQRRHDCDWVVSLGGGSGFLQGKHVEERAGRVLIRDPRSGRRWEYLLDGRRLVQLDDRGRRLSEQAKTTGVLHQPLTTVADADRWFDQFAPAPPAENEAPAPDWLVREFGGRYLTAAVVGGGFHQLCYAVGLESALIMLMEAPAVVSHMLERFMAGVPARARRLAAMGYDAGLVVDSYGSADIISPRAYADRIAPIHRAHARALTGAGLKAILYQTGDVMPLLPALGALGFDALSFEERSKGRGLDLADMRRALGPRPCLFGNFDAYLLLRGDRDAVRREVERQLAAGRDGAFIMSTGSPVCDATDPDIIDYWIARTRGASDATFLNSREPRP